MLYEEKLELARDSGRPLKHSERRRTPRFLTAGPAVMCWVGRGYNSFQAEVDVTNVVAGGLQLKCSKPVVNGTHVKVLGEAMEITTVRLEVE